VKANSGFDFLAPVYDALAPLIFGRSIVRSQTWFLDKIPPNAKVLILGGGTGWILKELLEKNSTCPVWYVEASAKMMERTRARLLRGQVTLIHGTENDIPANVAFDVIITNFYLDLFSERKLEKVIKQISNQTQSSSRWLVTDFVNREVWWQRLMLKIMYLFFRSICDIEAERLPNWITCLNTHQWTEASSKDWYGAFIRSTVWDRT
jgi:ubiquinone/menaquinone biosynthesis C-methylase UbiE